MLSTAATSVRSRCRLTTGIHKEISRVWTPKNTPPSSTPLSLGRPSHFSSAAAPSNNNQNTSKNKIPFYGLPRPPKDTSTSASSSSWKQRLVVALKSASTAFRDPTRDDAVAALGEVTGRLALEGVLKQMRQHPTGRLILQDKPLITKESIPYEQLLQQAENMDSTPPDKITFGQAYGHFLAQHGFDPEDRKPVSYLDQHTDLAYVMMRYRQCHDYWHALTGLPPTVLGEIALKWLELFQSGLPIAALSGTVGALGMTYKQQQILWQVYLPWAIRVHKRQQQLDPHGSILTVYYEKEFETPLVELQARMGIEPAPVIGDEY